MTVITQSSARELQLRTVNLMGNYVAGRIASQGLECRGSRPNRKVEATREGGLFFDFIK